MSRPLTICASAMAARQPFKMGSAENREARELRARLRPIQSEERKKTMKKVDTSNRRNFLKATGAALAAASVPAIAAAAPERERNVYLQGCGWNHQLPGVFGQVCLTLDVRAQLGSTGLGTFRDDVHPEINSQFQIHSATRRGDVYTLQGEVVSSRDPDLVGKAVRIVAEADGDRATGTITVGPTSQPLVVIAIIAILIGLLVPAVQ
jgi:hypothetical protein